MGGVNSPSQDREIFTFREMGHKGGEVGIGLTHQ